jgi:hypothetical protein
VPRCGYRLEDTVDDDIDATGAIPGMHDSAESRVYVEEMRALPLIVAERGPPAYLM